MGRDSETTKQLIGLALKEYEALRKGIDERADVTKTYGLPVVVLSLGAIASFKSDLIPINTALAFIPALVFSVAALDANANHDKVRVRRSLALVEDRIFILSGEPALCHESMALIKCRNRASKQLKLAVAYTVAYALIETVLSLFLLQTRWGSIDWIRTFLYASALSIPAILLLYSSYGAGKVSTAPLSTLLLEHIERSKGLNPDGRRLLYNTKAKAVAQNSEIRNPNGV